MRSLAIRTEPPQRPYMQIFRAFRHICDFFVRSQKNFLTKKIFTKKKNEHLSVRPSKVRQKYIKNLGFFTNKNYIKYIHQNCTKNFSSIQEQSKRRECTLTLLYMYRKSPFYLHARLIFTVVIGSRRQG